MENNTYLSRLTKIKDYKLQEIIGKGSYGQVYKAEKNKKIYAIKVLDKQQIKEKNLQKYVNNEVQIMKNINHQNIVQFYEAFENSFALFIVMEYCNEGPKAFQNGYMLPQSKVCNFLDEKTPSISTFYKKSNTQSIYENNSSVLYCDLNPEDLEISIYNIIIDTINCLDELKLQSNTQCLVNYILSDFSFLEFNVWIQRCDKAELSTEIGKPSFNESGSLIEYKKNLILFGGFSIQGVEQNNIFVNIYSMKNHSWTIQKTFGSLKPVIRFGHGAVVYKNYMVVFGGAEVFCKNRKQRNFFNDLWMLNLDNFEWQLIKCNGEIPETRRNFGFCLVGNHFYAYGGISQGEKVINQLSMINLDDKDHPLEWIQAKTLGTPPCNRYQHSQVYNQDLNCLIIHSGRTDDIRQKEYVLKDVYVLQMFTMNWICASVSGNSNFERFSHAYTQTDQRIFIFGGASQDMFNDCGLYILEMDQYLANKMKYLNTRDSFVKKASLLRLNNQNEEEINIIQQQTKCSNDKINYVKSFQPTPNKQQLKIQNFQKDLSEFENYMNLTKTNYQPSQDNSIQKFNEFYRVNKN
ncbi:kelch motif family protein, putative [Ichthyophthirius multifiliis]|uniref:Kelch motif family protein, putative n=1 Tax=Ichthyophthirius multifiliis TaxID=5932 RepID=G0QWP4_ICHMU|nr:kelch motif family protein, putative [Ichthyophthirius multifiliis]EGR30359.1 kelch motif family protein, putative [Ichthyophthirius multifiliis]|eukprot:XP_004031946.1 kelch motif family protein, putative [Ichthyophthirius multifiliis]